MRNWRESRVLLIVTGLAVLAAIPAVLTAMGVKNVWLLGSAIAGAAVVVAIVAMWQERYKRVRWRMLGEEHPDTLTSRNNLAHVLYGLGRLEEAEAEHRAEFEIHQPDREDADPGLSKSPKPDREARAREEVAKLRRQAEARAEAREERARLRHDRRGKVTGRLHREDADPGLSKPPEPGPEARARQELARLRRQAEAHEELAKLRRQAEAREELARLRHDRRGKVTGRLHREDADPSLSKSPKPDREARAREELAKLRRQAEAREELARLRQQARDHRRIRP